MITSASYGTRGDIPSSILLSSEAEIPVAAPTWCWVSPARRRACRNSSPTSSNRCRAWRLPRSTLRSLVTTTGASQACLHRQSPRALDAALGLWSLVPWSGHMRPARPTADFDLHVCHAGRAAIDRFGVNRCRIGLSNRYRAFASSHVPVGRESGGPGGAAAGRPACFRPRASP